MNKILYVNTSDCVGGAAKVAWNLGHNLGQKYTSSYIVYTKSSDEKNIFQIQKNPILNITDKIFGKKYFNYFRYCEGFILSDDIDYGFGWKQIKNNSYFANSDIVHCHNLHGNYFKLSTLLKINKPLVWTLHDEWAIMPHGAWSDCFDPINKFYKRKDLMSYPPMIFNNEKYLMKRKKDIYKKIDPIIVTPSLWLKKRVENSILGDKTIKLIPNGIDTNIYKRQNKMKLREKLKLPVNKKIILFLASGGKNNPQKGWKHVNKIISDLSNENFVFMCVGGSNEKVYTEGNVYYVPYMSDEKKLSEYYSASDVFLFTSNHENFPLTTLEAMASGLPVVSFNVGGVSEQIIDDKTGCVVDMYNYYDIEKQIVRLMNNQELLKKMSLEANMHVNKNYSLQTMVDRYMKLYESLIK